MPTEATLHGRLPLETWDNVVDHLWNDRRALTACSLTCHALLPASRYHAFYYVCLHDAARYHSFVALLSENNYVQRYVRALAVHGYGWTDSEHQMFPSNGKWLDLLPKLDRLWHLWLRQFTFYIPPELRGTTGSLVRGIRALDLTLMASEADDLASLIRACGALSTLIHRSPASPCDMSALASPTHDVRDCTIGTLIWQPETTPTGQRSSLAALTEWLERGKQPLRRLAVTRIHAKSSPLVVVQKVLDASGDSLEHLFLEFADLIDDHSTPPLIDLRNNTRLKTLHLAVQSPNLLDITHMLSIPSSRDALGHLTSLNFRIVTHKDSMDQLASDWVRFCIGLNDLCLTYPLLNCTLGIDLRNLWRHAIPSASLPELSQSITGLQTQLVCSLMLSLPRLSRVGGPGRLRFGVVWMWAGGDAFFQKAPNGRWYPPEYFLGDPEWYYKAQAPWEF
ncbi:uncharacterized protein B0H18DRAFT_1213663 [Fomitopsis serialis]|uniref:uncharacterized protein n=1 Tax=Fomitopsis serialis TaxID=139415 RepID=UPI002007A735|nr:uncharacterized protein B0H18DRAFT_1213663 [Neoantrodia serialis]KAH9919863.1 hypothetical protein B0H18DRAFT_1213663 [Neoantrodia serialis]